MVPHLRTTVRPHMRTTMLRCRLRAASGASTGFDAAFLRGDQDGVFNYLLSVNASRGKDQYVALGVSIEKGDAQLIN